MENAVEPQPSQIVLKLADPGKRFFAMVIDVLTFLMAHTIFSYAVTSIVVQSNIQSIDFTRLDYTNFGELVKLLSQNQLATAITTVVDILIFAGIFVAIPSLLFKGQTLGKRLLSVRIVKEDGSVPTIETMFIRHLAVMGFLGILIVPFVNILVCCGAPIYLITNLVLLMTDPKHQTIGDKLAKTVVIE